MTPADDSSTPDQPIDGETGALHEATLPPSPGETPAAGHTASSAPPPREHGPPRTDGTAATLYLSAAVLLTVFAYYGRTSGLRGTELHTRLSSMLGPLGERFHDLLPYAWWGANSLVLRVAIPCIILIALGIRLRDAGLALRAPPAPGAPRIPGTDRIHVGWIYLGLYLVMLPMLAWAAGQADFQAKYPLYTPAREGGADFWLFQLSYALQFLGVEFFFRGFLLFPLHRRIGHHALYVSMIPYVMVHFGKPFAETIGAIVAGLVLGALALRSGTIWLGVMLHCAIAVTMDVLVIAHHAGGLAAGLARLF